ncbi:MAG: ATP-binding protein [Patescibacteria group bacterium]
MTEGIVTGMTGRETQTERTEQDFLNQVEKIVSLYKGWRGQLKAWCASEPKELPKYIDTIQEFLREIASVPFLSSVESYKSIMGGIKNQVPEVHHDVNNYIAAVFACLDLVRLDIKDEDMDSLQEDLPDLRDSLSRAVLTSEDSALRFREPQIIPPGYPRESLDMLLVQRMIESQLKCRVSGSYRLAANEEVRTVPSLVANALLNIIRNAGKEEIGAHSRSGVIAREGSDLVIRIMDDGVGMTEAQLNPDSPKSFVLRGNSGTGSTGLGTRFLDTRLESVGGHLIVMSRKKSDKPHPYAIFASDKRPVNQPEEALAFNTIFEIHLPITQKRPARQPEYRESAIAA